MPHEGAMLICRCVMAQVTKTQEASLRVMWGSDTPAAAPAPAALPKPSEAPKTVKGVKTL